MSRRPPLALRTRRLEAIVGPGFIVSVHAEANRVWVTSKEQIQKPAPRLSFRRLWDDDDW